MKIFSADQTRQWDAYTIAREPVDSLQLMERAAIACYQWLLHYGTEKKYIFFCGTGNNGGDGLAIARLLHRKGIEANVFIAGDIDKGSADFANNLDRFRHTSVSLHYIKSPKQFPVIPAGAIVIDAIFGTGLNKHPEGIYELLIDHINQSGCEIIAIDMPSGLFADKTSLGNVVVHASNTLSFQCNKLAFMMPENEAFTGRIQLLDIGLDKTFYEQEKSNLYFTDATTMKKIIRPRKLQAHKGNFGHALLIGGSHGKMGAMILAAKACLRSGAGLLTIAVHETANVILQTTVPEAMTETGELTTAIIEAHNCLGIGPGWGMSEKVQDQLHLILQHGKKPMVLDADALNCLSLNKAWLKLLPPYTILTPHPKEFERLFGPASDDFAKLELARQQSLLYNIIIVLKGHYTAVFTPAGDIHFNSTGNPGMAKGGSGDVLTGFITGLLAQGYTPEEACLMGVYLHGLAGDIAAEEFSMQAMTAVDLTNCLGKAFQAVM